MFFKTNYLNKSSYYKFKINLTILYLLNLSDLFFTKFILTIEPTMFKEVNIFLEPIIGGISPYFLKIVIVGVVIYYWYAKSREFSEKELKLSLITSIGLLIVYILINLLHLFNMVYMFYLK